MSECDRCAEMHWSRFRYHLTAQTENITGVSLSLFFPPFLSLSLFFFACLAVNSQPRLSVGPNLCIGSQWVQQAAIETLLIRL